ncbi:hypothetical protein U1Q18_038425 [Sarracenia purpurea var. burkii]
MLLSPYNHQTSLPPKPLPNPSPPFPFFFPSPLLKTLHSQPSKSLFLRPAAAAASHADTRTLPQSAIKRIADKLRSLGYVEDDKEKGSQKTLIGSPGEVFIPLPKHLSKLRVGHTIDPSWSTPENPVPEPGLGNSIQKFHRLRREVCKEKYEEKNKKEEEARQSLPTLAEMTLPKDDLRRLRAIGIALKIKLKIGKAGVTEGVVNGIHERWRRSELVKIVCEDIWRMNMKRTHEVLERKTGGLVVWRSGSNIILYRGANYKYPYFSSDINSTNDTSATNSQTSSVDHGIHVRDEGCSSSMDDTNSTTSSSSNKMVRLIQGVGSPNRVRFQLPGERQLAEEADRLLEGLGPRFTDWWWYDPLPVDADLLPAIVPGYRKPFRLLPYGVKPRLTNDELTILKRLGRPLPCHFVLGRNRGLQGLAASMFKLWEKCEIAKIAVKRGVQNTRSELMAEELKWLTGGTLLSRDKDFIVLYRGKDFLPAAVSSAIEERRKCASHMEKKRTDYSSSVMTMQECTHGMVDSRCEDERDGIKDKERNLVNEQRKLRYTETAIKRTSYKLQMAMEKKGRAEKLLADLENEEIPQEAEIDKEGISEEERYMLRKVGLRMGPFLLLGRRGVFDGTVENMHLHWKYRELVKVICGGRCIEEVRGIAHTLETESGGILVVVERVSKGYAIIVYRGKNYKRPACLRPQTLLTKREAMKRSIEAQRRESLKLHVLKLSKDIDELQLQLTKDKETNDTWPAKSSSFQLATERSGVYSSSLNSKDGVDASRGCPETSQRYEEDEFKITEPEFVSESDSELKETNILMDMTDQGGDAQSVTCPDDPRSQGQTRFLPAVNAEPHVYNSEAITSVESPKSGAAFPVHSTSENISGGVPSRAARLSNRDRLLLRKQALKMKKRPVLAVGKSNIVTGVAKTIKAHFRKHPLAIVNVKGRAKGTSVQEVVFELEQATGAVLVSQEPSKVILYRGWGAEVERGRTAEKNTEFARKTSAEIEGGLRPFVSPELLSAIRLECGLQEE